MLCRVAVMVQAAGFDGVFLDLGPSVEDGLASSEIDVGGDVRAPGFCILCVKDLQVMGCVCIL